MKPLFACVFSSLSFSDTSLRLDSPRRGGRRAKHLLESRGGKKMLNKKKESLLRDDDDDDDLNRFCAIWLFSKHRENQLEAHLQNDVL